MLLEIKVFFSQNHKEMLISGTYANLQWWMTMRGGKIKRKPKGKLKYPFSYYWKSYAEWRCPFCSSGDDLFSSDNLDVVFCSGYEQGGYISSYACEANSAGGVDAEGHCKYCWAGDYGDRTFVKDIVYLCENCAHGVNFTKMELITDLFLHGNKGPCKHCSWHEKEMRKR